MNNKINLGILCLSLMLINHFIYSQDYEQKIKDLGIEIPDPPAPVANYVTAVKSGNLVFLAGHGPRKTDGTLITGRLGSDLTIAQGQEAARITGIGLLASLKKEIGSLNNVERIVKIRGMVNSTSDFTEHPQVVNGCSDLMVEIFGYNGKHARAAVGMGSLPGNIPIEIEMIVEVKSD